MSHPGNKDKIIDLNLEGKVTIMGQNQWDLPLRMG